MALALKIDPEHLPQPIPLPVELREPPPFEPQNMPPELLEDLRRRADVARIYLPKVTEWARSVIQIGIAASQDLTTEKLPFAERLAIQFGLMAKNVESSFGETLKIHENLRRFAELLEPSSRAAWFGFLDPYIKALREALAGPKGAAATIFLAIRITNPKWYPPAFNHEAIEQLIHARSADYGKILMENETGLTCEATQEFVGDIVIPVIVVHVSADMKRPHRVFADAENRVHENMERFMPELSGLVTFRYVADAHVA